MITMGFTGHRKLPDNNAEYKTPAAIYEFVSNSIERVLTDLKPSNAISGMAIGSDTIAAEVCLKLNIPLILAIPFRGQELRWPKEAQEKYNQILKQAKKLEYISPEGYSAWKMQTRNEWIVNNCDILIGIFNGERSGGTFRCIQFAKKQKKKIIIIDPKLKTIKSNY